MALQAGKKQFLASSQEVREKNKKGSCSGERGLPSIEVSKL